MSDTDISPAKTQQQKRGILKTVSATVVIILIVLGLFLNKMLGPKELSIEDLRENGAIIFETPRKIQSFALLDHTGKAFDNQSLVGQWTFIFFGFTFCPEICPMTLAKLAEGYQLLDAETQSKIKIIMISVDSERDTVEKMANYVPFFHPDFVGVTGEYLEMMKTIDSMNAAFTKVPLGDTYTIDHTTNVAIVNPQGDYHGFLKPPLEKDKIKTAIYTLVNQKN